LKFKITNKTVLISLLTTLILVVFANQYFLFSDSSLEEKRELNTKLYDLKSQIQRYAVYKLSHKPIENLEENINSLLFIISGLIDKNDTRYLQIYNRISNTWNKLKTESNSTKIISDESFREFDTLISTLKNDIDAKYNALIKTQFIFAVLIFILVLIIIFVLNKTSSNSLDEDIIDETTNFFKRKCFVKKFNFLEEMFFRYQRPFSAVYVKLENFKTNKTSKNKILKKFSSAIRNNLRNTDTPFVYEENAFLVLLPETKQDKANIILKRIKEELDSLFDESIKYRVIALEYRGEGVFNFIEKLSK